MTNWVAQNNNKFYSSTVLKSRSKKSTCQQNMFPPKPLRQDPFLIFFPDYINLRPSLAFYTSLGFLSLSSHGHLFSVSVSSPGTLLCVGLDVQVSFFLISTPIFSIRAHPNDIILMWLCLQLPYFQIMSHSRALGIRFSTHIFREHYSTHNRDPVKMSDFMFSGQQPHLWCSLLLSIWCNLNLTPSGSHWTS